ncbi:unnamed protein product [Clonostachys solani]|uniref:Uncharacterized protein n=1 Tax=Clonostachys solani TaxID=160281 RepID=A0A9N9Z4X2_9HYPO|nr:unnamed protein product [Clonostachys solani]
MDAPGTAYRNFPPNCRTGDTPPGVKHRKYSEG